jgi:hypothetical protein
MKFKIEIWHAFNDYQETEIEAIDAVYALKFAKQMYTTATKINVTQIKKLWNHY